jgi:predicted nucleic acid-binding protein
MAGRAGRPIGRSKAFWDSSALVPLCVRQSMTPNAVARFKVHDLVVWWAAPVEIAGALARLLRMKQINPPDWAKARKLANILSDSWSVIQPSNPLRTRALQIVDMYDLRAAGSFQLAAALDWCEGAPQGRVFLTIDKRLRDAALLSGFDAQQM